MLRPSHIRRNPAVRQMHDKNRKKQKNFGTFVRSSYNFDKKPVKKTVVEYFEHVRNHFFLVARYVWFMFDTVYASCDCSETVTVHIVRSGCITRRKIKILRVLCDVARSSHACRMVIVRSLHSRSSLIIAVCILCQSQKSRVICLRLCIMMGTNTNPTLFGCPLYWLMRIERLLYNLLKTNYVIFVQRACNRSTVCKRLVYGSLITWLFVSLFHHGKHIVLWQPVSNIARQSEAFSIPR